MMPAHRKIIEKKTTVGLNFVPQKCHLQIKVFHELCEYTYSQFPVVIATSPILRRKKKRSPRHGLFHDGHRSKYYHRPTGLNFCDFGVTDHRWHFVKIAHCLCHREAIQKMRTFFQTPHEALFAVCYPSPVSTHRGQNTLETTTYECGTVMLHSHHIKKGPLCLRNVF